MKFRLTRNADGHRRLYVMMRAEVVPPFFRPMNGQLREHPLAELIREIAIANLSGSLRLARERVQAVLYAEAGQIVFARSNLRAYRLAACLQRWKVVEEDQLSMLVTEFMSDAETAAALIGAGLFKADALLKLQAGQMLDVIRPLLLWTDGKWSFDARARLAEEARYPLQARGLLLEGVRQLPTDFVASRLTSGVEVISPVAEIPEQLQLLPVEGFILSRVDAPLALDELLALSGLPDPTVRQAVYTLALTGFLARAAWPVALSANSSAQAQTTSAAQPTTAASTLPAPPAVREQTASDPAAAAAVPKTGTPYDPRAEIDALFSRVRDADYYGILGIARDAAASEIKPAYYALAKRFHPDRFQREAGEAERAQIEHAFTQITQAYETLRDARTRAAYDNKMSAKFNPPDAPAASRRAGGQPGYHQTANTSSPIQRAEESFRQGLEALKGNDYGAAVILLGEAVRFAPQQPRYHAFYGNALARDARTQRQAEIELQAAIKLDDRDPSYRVMLADLYRMLGQTLRAERELERALAINPNQESARRMLDGLRKSKP